MSKKREVAAAQHFGTGKMFAFASVLLLFFLREVPGTELKKYYHIRFRVCLIDMHWPLARSLSKLVDCSPVVSM